MTEYGYAVEVAQGYDEAVLRARLALRAEGFSIITEMHVGGLLGPEAGGERQYLFMGAWTAPGGDLLPAPGLDAAGHLLSCNVVVHETDQTAIVAALDPADGLDGIDSATGRAAETARLALSRALERIAAPE